MSIEDRRIDPEGCGGNAAPYVLGALTDQEHQDFLVHMESCAVCREEVAVLQAVAATLPATAPQLTALPELKQRIMATVHEEARERKLAESISRRRRSPLPWLSWRPALAAAVAAVAIALVAVTVFQGGSGAGGGRVIRAEVLAPKATASIRLSGGHAQLEVSGMPQTSIDRVYEVWIERSGAPQPTDALFTVTPAGDASVGVPGSVKGVKQILVTSEPVGGSRVPTTKPVIIASLA